MRKLKLCLIATIALFAIGMQTTRAAAIDYLTGWTEVTSLPTDNSELSKYYFVFVATEADLMLAQEYGTGKLGDSQEDLLTVVYRTPGNPLTAKKFVWMLSYDATYLFGIRNLNNSTYYMQSRKNNPWRVQFNWETAQSEWTQWKFAYADSKWTIQNKMSSGNGGGDDYYLGYWVDSSTANAYKDNMVAAGNKGAGDYQGKFKIYRISREDFKAPTDVTSSYITNPSFEYSAEGTAATAGDITTGCYGWSIPTLGSNSNRSIGSSTGCNGQAAGIPTPSDGSFYYFNRQGWNGSGNTYTLSTTATLPVGAYTLLMDYKGVDSYNNDHTGKNSTIVLKATKGSDLNFTTSPNFTSYSVQNTNTNRNNYFVNNGWKTMSLPFVIDSEGEVTLSIVQNMKGGVRTDIVLDNFHLLYSNINVESLAALIAQATSINSETEDLTSAIATAQTVYDGINNTAAYQSTIDDAISTLKSAIATSVAGISMNHRDDLSYLIANVGFEGLTEETSDYGTGNGKDYSDGGWVLTTTGSFSYGAVLSYGSGNKINQAAIPATDNAGNTGKAFGLSAGWDGSQIYQTAPITLPAGKYIFKVNTYNAGTSTPLTSKFGFVPTSGDATLSTKTSYAKGSWETEEVTLTLGAATEGCFQFGGVAASGGSDNTAKVFYDNITLTYITDLGLAKEPWDAAKAAAEAARDNSDYSNVTGDERTNLETEIGKSEPNTVGGYNDATSNLETATATFIAAKSEYDRYAAEKANADRINTSIASGISAPTTAAGCDAVINSILVAEYNYVKDNYNADAATKYGMTIDLWTGTATSGGNADTPQTRSNEKWGESATTYYEQGANGWGSSSWTLNYSITKTLPAGNYVLKISARASEGAIASLKATVGEETITEQLPSVGSSCKGVTTTGIASFDEGDFANSGNGFGWQWRYLAITLDGEADVTFQIDASANAEHQWCSFGDVSVLSYVDLTALKTAYSAFVMDKTLGFEKDQYAPYNNVTVLEAYARAKAIIVDGSEPEDQEEANELTSILSSPSWTKNVTDVDAIYNGTFSETGTGDNPKGWTRSNNGWGKQVTGLTSATNGVNEGTTTGWYYNNNGAWLYGNDGCYTMPLAANTDYVLKFKYRKHNNDWQTWMKASVLNADEEGLNVVQYPGANDGTTFETAEAYFTTGDAGNYILSIENYGNAHLTDVSLVKVASTTKTLDESTTFSMTPKYSFADVQLTRNFSAGVWNTFVVPFDIDNETLTSVFGDDVKVAEATLTSTSVSFNTMETPAITANKPVIIKGVSKTGSYNFDGVLLKNATPTISNEGTSFVGNYDAEISLGNGVYYIASNKMKRATGSQKLKGFRAYFTTTSEARLSMFLDDEETTGIEGLNVRDAQSEGEVYNLNGMKMTEGSKLQKGIYVKNGKKVVIK